MPASVSAWQRTAQMARLLYLRSAERAEAAHVDVHSADRRAVPWPISEPGCPGDSCKRKSRQRDSGQLAY